jgi:hypothetical protein
MAEATLNDVSNAIREDGNKDREQLKGDSIRQFLQLRSSNKLLKSLTQAQIDSNEQMKKQFEQQQEALRRENAKKALGEPANDNDSRFKRMMIGLVDSYKGVKKLLDNIKKAMPNKATMFTLLFGGLAAAFAFFPKEVKEYLIDPLIDVINVFRDKDYTTTLGMAVYGLKEGLGWISENISPDAAWIAGILGTATALKAVGLPTLGLGSILGELLKFARAHPLITAAVFAIGGLIKLFDFFRRKSIKNETEKSEALLKEYKAAKTNEERAEIAARAATAQYRIRETAIGNVDSIQGPLDEINALDAKRVESKLQAGLKELGLLKDEAKKKADDLADAIAAEKAAKDKPEERQRKDERQEAERQAAAAKAAAEKARNEAVRTARRQSDALISESKNSNELLAAYKVSLKDAIDKLKKAGLEGQELELAMDAVVQNLNVAVTNRRRNADFTKENVARQELNMIKAAATNASNESKLIEGLEAGNKAGTFIAVPVTNNSDNKKTVNNTNVLYNVFTDSNLNPLTGLYENGVVPTYM